MLIKNKLFVIVFLLVSVIEAVTLIQAEVPSAKERENIAQVIKQAVELPGKVYTQARSHHRNKTLAENRVALMNNGKRALQELFTDDLAQRLSKSWVENQLERVVDGPDQIDSGVSNVEITDLSISGDKAYVTAVVEKYFVDRITRDGKNYIDRMEGKSTIKATLVKVDGKWKIAEYTSQPSLNPKHIIQPE
ncbi:hypothetical protein SAMN05660826_01801 [Caldanaerovirga acetigignens]|uniref:SnoaL-like domain-containing protein n=1 Tax=Caldanaerovirga acetigignens TaxID=447595 RepID=A0A1M7L8I4_9FIRM|nr:hypothetical protein [Caldanaerovirga acetigignens]SHM73832.1 hypothetical protein SAMN05660826_01801 [Caldanaerovirga acetigignens]